MRAFVYRIEPVVAIQLLQRILARVTITAQDLNGEAVCFETPLRRPGLYDRGQDLEQQMRFATDLLARARLLIVEQARGIQTQRETTFDIRLLREQHAANIGMLDEP